MLTDLLVKNASSDKLYVEDVFSTWLYTGNGSTQTITNGINLSGKGGLTWIKYRDGTFGNGHYLYDTARGVGKALQTNTTDVETTADSRFTAFNSNGFSLSTAGGSALNASAYNYASWTFRKAPKFFDVVTYTGNGVAGRTISHSLGSVPGMIIVKGVTNATDWSVYHRSLGNATAIDLNLTGAAYTHARWNNTTPTDTVFTVSNSSYVNANGQTYVAYLFAHDTTADGVIQCGSYTGNGSTTGPEINLGWEPQFVLIKNTTTGGANYNWFMFDTMREITTTNANGLFANLSSAEAGSLLRIGLTSTGFKLTTNIDMLNGSGSNYIYLAIRRGPMRVPTDATKVYDVKTRTGTGGSASISGLTAQPDVLLAASRDGWSSPVFYDRLRGFGQSLTTVSSSSEGSATDSVLSMTNTAINLGSDSTQGYVNWSSKPYVNYILRRAPGFFDVVCYTGTGSARTVNHNLGVAPELMIVKSRSNSYNWWVYSASTGNNAYLIFNTNDLVTNSAPGAWNQTSPTASVFSLGTYAGFNASGYTYVAYLFATCPGVSKVGSYTGTGTTLQINCGFTNGARFVLIKRTDSTGDWYVWDSARGIVAGNDPYLLLNSLAAEVTNTDYVDAYSAGFELSSTAPAALNANGGTYIYLAIA